MGCGPTIPSKKVVPAGTSILLTAVAWFFQGGEWRDTGLPRNSAILARLMSEEGVALMPAASVCELIG
jgi:hypothetical protein